MAIYTTYLAKLKNDPKMPERIGACHVYIVTTRSQKENRCVAPDWSFLDVYKKDTDCDSCSCREARDPNTCDQCHEDAFAKYTKFYLEKIRNSVEAQKWMWKRYTEGLLWNILLVCYEKDPRWCHRRLLAEELTKFDSINGKHAEYKGDWNDGILARS